MKGAGAGSRSKGSRSKEQGARGAEERKHEEQGAARCTHTIGAITMLVAVHSAVEQALQQASSLTGDNANHVAWAWGGLGMRSCKLHAYREVAKGMVTQASWADVEL